MRFYLGTHMTEWLKQPDRGPLFVSAARLRRRPVRLPARCGWALDSSGFMALHKAGRWDVGPEQYAAEVRRWRAEIGRMEWAAVQDWMCEAEKPNVLLKTALAEGLVPPGTTRLTAGQQAERVDTHQRRTIRSWFDLTRLAPEVPWVPVLQGWEYGDYLRHLAMYAAEGIDLAALPLVGVGSVCRRQDTRMVEELVRELHGRGLRVHGFGFKLEGVGRCHRWLASADSLAWSYRGRRAWDDDGERLCGREHPGGCANCRPWAERWRGRVRRRAPEPAQPTLF